MYVSGNPYFSMDPDGMDECSLACQKMRQLSDWFSSISRNVGGSGHGVSAPLADASDSARKIVSRSYEDAADGAADASDYADAALGSAPGGDALACATSGCSTGGWAMAVVGLVPGEGAAGHGVFSAGSRLEFNQAMNAALRWLEARGFKAEANVLNKFPTAERYTRVIGKKTADGRTGYRIEFDANHGAHVNTFSGKDQPGLFFVQG